MLDRASGEVNFAVPGATHPRAPALVSLASRKKPIIRIRRIYATPKREEGFRILVDRLWPRGFSKSQAGFDLWLREIAPSDALRKWFAHDTKKWPAFQKRYAQELKEKRELLWQIKQLEKRHGALTLLYAAKDEKHNNAAALQLFLRRTRRQ